MPRPGLIAAWILFALPGVGVALLWPGLTLAQRVWGAVLSISFYTFLDVIRSGTRKKQD